MTWRRGFWSLSGAILVFALSACSGGGSGGSAGNDRAVAQGQALELQGSWNTGCVDPREAGFGETATLTFTGSTLTRSILVGADGDCSSSYFEARIDGTYGKGSEVRSGIYALDLVITSMRVKPTAPRGVEVLNLARTCGIRDWKLNVERDVTAKVGRATCFARYPERTFSVYKIDGRRLFLGDGRALAVPELRPVKVDTSSPLARVL